FGNVFAIGMGDARGLVDEDAQHAARTAAEQLDLDDFGAQIAGYTFGDGLHLCRNRAAIRHIFFPENKKVGFRPLLVFVLLRPVYAALGESPGFRGADRRARSPGWWVD